jgi:hypothetical protein
MIFILGERPGPNTNPSIALYPHTTTGAAARLYRLLSLTKEEYLANTARLNAVDDPASSTSSPVARLRVEYFLFEAASEPFIVLGKSALKAMPPKYRKMQFGDIIDNVLLLPHTSGVNRVWNDPVFTAKMQKIAREFIDEQRSGSVEGKAPVTGRPAKVLGVRVE